MTIVKIIGIVGSPRHHGNTELMVTEALKGAEEVGNVETEIFPLAGKKINPCLSCFVCKKRKDFCIFRFKDAMQEFYEKYLSADGLIIGSPVYHLSISGILKNAIDRLGQGLISRYGETGLPWLCKVGGVLTQGGTIYGGQEYALQFLASHLIIMNNIVVSPDGINAIGVAGSVPVREPGAIVEHDPQALKRSSVLGRRVAEMAKVIKAGVETIKNELPEEYIRHVIQRQEFYDAVLCDKQPK